MRTHSCRCLCLCSGSSSSCGSSSSVSVNVVDVLSVANGVSVTAENGGGVEELQETRSGVLVQNIDAGAQRFRWQRHRDVDPQGTRGAPAYRDAIVLHGAQRSTLLITGTVEREVGEEDDGVARSARRCRGGGKPLPRRTPHGRRRMRRERERVDADKRYVAASNN